MGFFAGWFVWSRWPIGPGFDGGKIRRGVRI